MKQQHSSPKRARQALAAGHYAEAQRNFEQLAKLEPDIAEVHATLAAIYFKQREYEMPVQRSPHRAEAETQPAPNG